MFTAVVKKTNFSNESVTFNSVLGKKNELKCLLNENEKSGDVNCPRKVLCLFGKIRTLMIQVQVHEQHQDHHIT